MHQLGIPVHRADPGLVATAGVDIDPAPPMIATDESTQQEQGECSGWLTCTGHGGVGSGARGGEDEGLPGLPHERADEVVTTV